MSRNAKRRYLILAGVIAICIVVILLVNIFDETMDPSAYKYYIENIVEEADMPNAVTAIYLRYRLFDTLFEALLLAVAVSAVVYFASEWEKEKEEHEDE